MALIWPAQLLRDPDYFVTDFGEYATGAQPADWTKRYNTAGYTALVQSVAGSLSGKAMRFTKTATTTGMLSWDKVPPMADFEILARFRAIEAYAANDYFMRFGGRASGATSSENYVCGSIAGAGPSPFWQNVGVKYVAGAGSSIGVNKLPANAYSVNNWGWHRFRANGTSFSRKTWLQGASEPASFDDVVTDGSLITGGWVGMMLSATTFNPDMEIDFFSVALNGKTASSVRK